MKLFIIAFAIIVCSSSEASAPWGKDAELADKRHKLCQQETRCETKILGSIAEAAIRFHQEVISPADGPRSHYTPSSSQYTLEAMRKHGFAKGFIMGCDRLMRENNEAWVYKKDHYGMKQDPVR